MDLREIGWGGGLDSTGSGKGWWRAVVNVVMNLWVLALRSWLVSLGYIVS
jgi:hypothetical protein